MGSWMWLHSGNLAPGHRVPSYNLVPHLGMRYTHQTKASLYYTHISLHMWCNEQHWAKIHIMLSQDTHIILSQVQSILLKHTQQHTGSMNPHLWGGTPVRPSAKPFLVKMWLATTNYTCVCSITCQKLSPLTYKCLNSISSEDCTTLICFLHLFSNCIQLVSVLFTPVQLCTMFLLKIWH